MIEHVGVFILCGMAIWRLSSLVAREDGPLDMFEHLRVWVNQLADTEKNSTLRVVIESFYLGMLCMWCNSIWFSALFSFFISQSVRGWILNTLALGTMVIMIEVLIKGRTRNG